MNNFEYKKVSKAGGINIPLKLRREYAIHHGDPIEVETKENGDIVLRRYAPRCVFCNTDTDVELHMNKGICQKCFDAIKEVLA